jgi:hypothetical protein
MKQTIRFLVLLIMLCVMIIGIQGRLLHYYLLQDRPRLQGSTKEKTHTSDVPVEKILVVYSGPTDPMNPKIKPEEISAAHKKMELFRLNF